MPYIEKHMPEKPDAVTWAPLSRKRLRKRGYDQARLLAENIAKRLCVPCERLLEKTEDTPPQSGIKDAAERRANVLGAYRAAAGARIAGRRLLMADDILTTGSTMGECCRILGENGAEEIYCAAVAGGRKVAKDGGKDYCKS
jgi:competence protein ComFC